MMRIRKGDTVQVITGREKGKTGKVIEIVKDRVMVQGLNMVKRHQKPTQTQRQGGIVEKESSFHVSNVMLYDEKAAKGARVGTKVLEDGRKVRVSRRTGEVIEAGK
jgi:large subunit ribosomal protein L24